MLVVVVVVVAILVLVLVLVLVPVPVPVPVLVPVLVLVLCTSTSTGTSTSTSRRRRRRSRQLRAQTPKPSVLSRRAQDKRHGLRSLDPALMDEACGLMDCIGYGRGFAVQDFAWLAIVYGFAGPVQGVYQASCM